MLKKISLLVFSIIITGCASSSNLEKSASTHAKAADYYQSIGQHQAAREEHKLSQKQRKHANSLDSILVELFNLFTEQD